MQRSSPILPLLAVTGGLALRASNLKQARNPTTSALVAGVVGNPPHSPKKKKAHNRKRSLLDNALRYGRLICCPRCCCLHNSANARLRSPTPTFVMVPVALRVMDEMTYTVYVRIRTTPCSIPWDGGLPHSLNFFPTDLPHSLMATWQATSAVALKEQRCQVWKFWVLRCGRQSIAKERAFFASLFLAFFSWISCRPCARVEFNCGFTSHCGFPSQPTTPPLNVACFWGPSPAHSAPLCHCGRAD